ncbi:MULTISPECIES: NAD(P)-dependent oxidoreductase [unclassified Streptomyces]|uniref:NAD(P)-dependent oxidoreductase n=1 Tax=unclassified Streptomyces TaxID=2593676 RepID=UPI001654E95C|nr:NAD(P)H-binding protein [Streptomyces sp. CB02980]MCB8904466.1 NAD(P)H-binding protein [Streptomyces sp. CB02980]
MHIGVVGATGTIGSRVVAEALERGHHIRAFGRDATGAAARETRENITWASLDVLDPAGIAAVLPGLDVLISAFQPGNAAQDMADTVRRSIADAGVYATAARALLKALESHPRTRLIVIGGAGSLEIEPGVVLADAEERLHATLDGVGLPRAYAAAVRGHRDALNVLRTSNRRWTYFSPAEDIAPGERTGRFRIGEDQPVRDAEGRSRVSAEDAAVALVDEAELPRFVQRRFTVGY